MFASKPKDIPGVPRDVQRVYNLLTPKPKELLQHVSSRRFIREGEVGMYNHKEKRTKRRYLFLFNDVLLITKREGKTSYWLKIFISLRSNLTVEDVPDSTTKHKVEFRIYAPKKTIILFTHTEDEKLVWLNDLRNALAGNYTEKKDRNSGTNQTTSAPKEKQIVISGDIGTIEIPGLETTSLSNQAKRLSGERGDFDFDDDFIQYSSKSKLEKAAPIPEFSATPATPASTPVQPSILDEFESLANRSTTASTIPSFNPTQTSAFTSNTQFTFNTSNSAPLPATATATPTINFSQTLLQPTSPAVQPTTLQPTAFQSINLLSPTPVLQPTSTGILQPTPSNPAPAPLSGDFSALRSLSAQPQQPQQTAGQLFTTMQPQPVQNQSPFASLGQPLGGQPIGQAPTQQFTSLLGQPVAQPFGQTVQQPFGQPAAQPFGSQAYGQPYGQPAANMAFAPNYQMQMQQFQQLQQMQQMQQMQQLQAQQRMFGSGN